MIEEKENSVCILPIHLRFDPELAEIFEKWVEEGIAQWNKYVSEDSE